MAAHKRPPWMPPRLPNGLWGIREIAEMSGRAPATIYNWRNQQLADLRAYADLHGLTVEQASEQLAGKPVPVPDEVAAQPGRRGAAAGMPMPVKYSHNRRRDPFWDPEPICDWLWDTAKVHPETWQPQMY